MIRKFTKHRRLIGISCLAIFLCILVYSNVTMEEEFAESMAQVEDKLRIRFGKRLRTDSDVDTKSRRIHQDPDAVERHLIPEQMTCKIPVLDPFNVEFMRVVNNFHANPKHPCQKESPKFYTDYESNLIRAEGNEEYFNRVKCCYFPFTRGQDDMQIKKDDNNCHPITKNKTKIPAEHDFIAIKCNGTVPNVTVEHYMYSYGFVHLKPEVEKRAAAHEPKPDQLSIVLLGLDSVSQMNFQRYMPRTRKYLHDELSVIEFLGRNKVHESTFANVGPTLTGWTNDELTSTVKCWPDPPKSYFDDCPFIWKEYQALGYRTLYGEDEISFSIYLDSTLNGFKNAVADYDFRTLLRGMELLDGRAGCFTHQSSPEILIDSVAKAAVAFRNKLYFHFTWITSFTHNSAQATKYVDEPILKLLQMMKNENLLNTTAFFLLSDHGMTFGKYVETEQGMLESRMPMLNVILPTWFRAKYSKAVKNLETNTKRLSTPFDLHEMLTDFLDPAQTISNFVLERRETEYYSKNRGISLFLPIPLNRTCAEAGIDDHWCICWNKTLVAEPENNPKVLTAVEFSLSVINSKIEPFPMCAQLKLEKVLSARELHPVSTQMVAVTKTESRYEVVFQVSPSSGIFQSTVVLRKDANSEMGGPISRINAYKKQGDCIDTTKSGTLEVKSMCFCTT